MGDSGPVGPGGQRACRGGGQRACIIYLCSLNLYLNSRSSNMCANDPPKNLRLYSGLTGGQHPNPLNSFFDF